MGTVINGLGLGSSGDTGEAGAKFAASGANIQMPVDVSAAQSLQNQAQAAISQQQAFTEALAAQNGIGNQSNVYNQLGGIAAGTGPNPAMAALHQATAANTANQAALMAGQRGAGANAGLIARQAAMQGGANQQAAVGQGATMQAQQSLNALNMQGGLATQQVGQQAAANQAMMSGTQNEQRALLDAIAAQNNAQVGMRSNQNQSNAGVAGQNIGAAGGIAGSILGGLSAGFKAAKGGVAEDGMVKQYADGGGVAAPMAAPAPVAMPAAMPMVAAPTAAIMPAPTIGGQAALQNKAQAVAAQDPNAPKSALGQAFKTAGPFGAIGYGLAQGAKAVGSAIGDLFSGDGSSGGAPTSDDYANMYGGPGSPGFESGYGSSDTIPGGVLNQAHGGQVPAMVSPGEMYLPPAQAQAVAAKKASPMDGERIPGKATVKGDSLKNDTVPKTLEEGGVVIPRSIMESKDAAKQAAAFVAAHLAKNKRMPKKPD